MALLADFKQFKRQLSTALKEDLYRLLHMVDGEQIYGIALISDAFIDQLYLTLNSEEQLQEKIDEVKRKGGAIDAERLAKLRWVPDYWQYGLEHLQHPELGRINHALSMKEVSDFAQFELLFYETVLATFSEVLEDPLFAELPREKIACFITIAQDERATAIEHLSATTLNNEALAAEFLQRFDLN